MSSEAGDDTFVYMIATLSVIASTVGAVIRWRRPRNRIGGLLMAGAIMGVSAALTWPVQILLDPRPNGEIGLPLLLLLWWGSNGILFGVLVLFPGVAILFRMDTSPGLASAAPVTLAVGLIARRQRHARRSPRPDRGEIRAPLGLGFRASLSRSRRRGHRTIDRGHPPPASGSRSPRLSCGSGGRKASSGRR